MVNPAVMFVSEKSQLLIRFAPLALLIIIFSFQTWTYLPVWKNSVSLWSHTIATVDDRYLPFMSNNEPTMLVDKTPLGVVRPYGNLGQALAQVGLIDDAVLHST